MVNIGGKGSQLNLSGCAKNKPKALKMGTETGTEIVLQGRWPNSGGRVGMQDSKKGVGVVINETKYKCFFITFFWVGRNEPHDKLGVYSERKNGHNGRPS